MKKFVSDEELAYADSKRYLQSFYQSGIKMHGTYKDSKTLENSYLYQCDGFQDDEYLRLCTLLPLIKLEIENGMLSKELLEELEIYYADFNDGVLDDELYEQEYEEIKKDLYWCYENK